MNTNVFGRIGLDFMRACDSIREKYSEKSWFSQETSMDLSPILQTLKHCHIKEHFSLYAYPPENDSMSVPYALYGNLTPLNPKKYPGIRCDEELPEWCLPIDDAFEVDDCPEGVWEAFLLWDLPRHLPCVQHGAYGMRDLFLDLDTYDSFACLSQFIDKESGEIVEDKVQSFLKEIEGKTGYHQIRGYQSKEDLQMALALRGCPLLLPKVNMGAYRMYVTFWTPWTGLSRETIKITRRDNTYGFLSRNCESIAQYWWGITI